MSHLPGNPHALVAVERLLESKSLDTDATGQAILALAYEQRTATLLAFRAWEPTAPSTDADIALQAEIVSRLGLDTK